MSQNIESLWSPDIKATVLSPQTVLKGQAEALALKTGGILLAELTEEHEEGKVYLSFDLIAPALHGSRHRILRVICDENMAYPAKVEAEAFRPPRWAYTDQTFTATIAEVLRSIQVSSLAQSLVARANEALTATPAQ